MNHLNEFCKGLLENDFEEIEGDRILIFFFKEAYIEYVSLLPSILFPPFNILYSDYEDPILFITHDSNELKILNKRDEFELEELSDEVFSIIDEEDLYKELKDVRIIEELTIDLTNIKTEKLWLKQT